MTFPARLCSKSILSDWVPVAHDRLSLPWPGPSWHQQFLPSKDWILLSTTLFNLHHGTPPFRPGTHDPPHKRKPNPCKPISSKKWWGNTYCVLQVLTFSPYFQDEFKRVITLVEDAILATDLAVYFRRRNETFEKMSSNTLEWTTEDKDR